MDELTEKYARQAEGWTEAEYADPHSYLAHRADLIVSLGRRLEPGDLVLDLACADGGLGPHVAARGLRYLGVETNEAFVAAARARGVDVVQGDLNDWEPGEPAAATTLFRAIYYAHDRVEFFRRVARFTERKLVFDFSPRRCPPHEIYAGLRAAGWRQIEARPFFSPQKAALPVPAAAALRALERSGPLARALLRVRFSYVVAASH
jgi:hypothetical protein